MGIEIKTMRDCFRDAHGATCAQGRNGRLALVLPLIYSNRLVIQTPDEASLLSGLGGMLNVFLVGEEGLRVKPKPLGLDGESRGGNRTTKGSATLCGVGV